MKCPKCESENIIIQNVQTGNLGVGTNKVIIEEPKKSKGCLYWLCFGWFFSFFYWICIGWWWKLLFGRKKKNGVNFHANKTITKTMAICQNCGHTWKV